MELPELIRDIRSRVDRAADLLDDKAVEEKRGQAREYYKAQTELMSYITAHAWDILDHLDRLQEMDEKKVKPIAPDPMLFIQVMQPGYVFYNRAENTLFWKKDLRS